MLENLEKELKQDITKDILLKINLQELSKAMLPHLLEEWKRNPFNIIEKHQEAIKRLYKKN